MKTKGEMLMFSSHDRERGLTLIEIMVALLIGSFLLAGVIQIFIVNKQTYRVQENLSRMQENGRFAIDYLNRYIRLAGYIADEPFLQNKNQNKISMTAKTFPLATKPAISGANDNPGSLNDSDTITIRYLANPPYNPMTDCLGNTIANSPNGDVVVTNQFIIPSGLQDNNLYCGTVHNTASGAVVAGSAQRQPVIDGIENMQIRYCQKTGSNNISCVSADSVPNSEWDKIESIKISLLVRSTDDNLVSDPKSYQFDQNGDGDDEIITPADRRLRRVFTTTIAMRNLMN